MFFNIHFQCLLLIFLVQISFASGDDIFNMFGRAQDQPPIKVPETTIHHNSEQTCSPSFGNEFRTILSAYRHFVADLLEKLPSKTSGKYRLLIELSTEELKRLQKFATSNVLDQTTILKEVHMINDLLGRMVRTVEQDTTFDINLSWSAWFRSFDINLVIQRALVILAVVAMSFISIRLHLRRGRWISSFLFVAFSVSVLQNWYTLYLEAQAKIDQVLTKQLPTHCRGHSMGILDTIKYGVGRFFKLPVDECAEYYKALRATPHSQVTPVQAFSMTFAQLFTTPLGAIGEGFSQFFAGILRHIPVILWPVIIIITIVLVIIFALMISRYEVHLPFMMGSLKPCANVASIDSAKETVTQLENRIHQLEAQLEEKKERPALEKRPSSPPPLGFRPEFLEESMN